MPISRFNISTLIYCFDRQGRVLLMRRNQAPNQGLWSPPGGKLSTTEGESPHHCAAREAREELGITSSPSDYHLTGIVTERAYEDSSHWMMFLFELSIPLETCPEPHVEGSFAFFDQREIQQLEIPETDKAFIWPLFWQHRQGFFAVECECQGPQSFHWNLVQSST